VTAVQRIKASTTVYPFNYYRAAARTLLEEARENPEGSTFKFLAAMLFSAFALESYLNHLGGLRCKGWDVCERRLGPKEKLVLVAAHIGAKPDLGRRPFQTFGELFKFRDLSVHARVSSTTVTGLWAEDKPDSESIFLRTNWTEQITLDKAERFFEDTRAMLDWLYRESGCPGPVPGTLEQGEREKSPVEGEVDAHEGSEHEGGGLRSPPRRSRDSKGNRR